MTKRTFIHRLQLLLGLVLAVLTVPAPAGAAVSYLTNNVVEVGVELDAGGVITHVAPAGGESVVSDYNFSRQVQQTYYSGPETLCSGGGWTVAGTGDRYGNPSEVVAHTNDGTTIYVKSVPKLWSCVGIACECAFEHWITLEGRSVRVRGRLTNNRGDRAFYPAAPQELPAMTTVATLHRLFTYHGPSPYTNAPLHQVHGSVPAVARWTATEGWAAFVNDAGWGLGLFSPTATAFWGGFLGTPGAGGPYDFDTGYVAATRREHLDWNIVYEHEYALVLGTLQEIRDYAVARRPERRPDYQFAHDRQGWWYIQARDQGFPFDGFLRVGVDLVDPQMWRLDQWFAAEDVPRLMIRMRHHSQQRHAQLFWSGPGGEFSESSSVVFDVKPDGRWHTYVLDLRGRPGWQGPITGLRLDPVAAGGEPGGYVDVASISWKQAQRTLRVATSGSGTVRSEPAGVACPPTCTGTFGEGSEVALVAEAASGWAFAGWRGACTDVSGCRVAVDEDVSVEAVFVPARHARRVSLALRRHLFASGVVTVADGYEGCRVAMTVEIQRRVGRRWRRVASATTGDSGAFRARIRDRAGRYRARLLEEDAAEHACLAATSTVRAHNHPRKRR